MATNTGSGSRRAQHPQTPDTLAAYREASAALQKEMQRLYPIGSDWLVHTRRGQKVAAVMTVIGHETGWICLVRFERPGNPKKFGYGPPRTFRVAVPLDRILHRA